MVRIQDLIHKKIPADMRSVLVQVLDLKDYLDVKPPTDENFTAGKGWLKSLRIYFLSITKFLKYLINSSASKKNK